MVKFYVYTSEKDEYEFIEADAIDNFAAHEYNPKIMKFSGVMIDAKDFHEALETYLNPSCGGGEYMMSDEPSATITRRQMMTDTKLKSLEQSFKDAKFKLEYLRCMMKMKQAAAYMQMASKTIEEVSKELHVMYGQPPHVKPNYIFEELSKSTFEAIVKFNGDSKKTG